MPEVRFFVGGDVGLVFFTAIFLIALLQSFPHGRESLHAGEDSTMGSSFASSFMRFSAMMDF